MTEETQLTPDERRTLLTLARSALEAHVHAEKPLDTEGVTLTPSLKEKRGAFVTLTIGGQLRGCIGYVDPIKPLWQAVVENAVNAAVNDPRFGPVAPRELGLIHIEISAMTPLKPVSDASEVEVGRHGLMISKGFCRGLLLPQVATEYGWNRDQFLRYTCQKAGLPMDAWRDPQAKIESFCAEVFGEGEGE